MMFVRLSPIKGYDICFSQHHGTKLLLCNVVFHDHQYVVPSFCDTAFLTRTYVTDKQSCSCAVAGCVAAFA